MRTTSKRHEGFGLLPNSLTFTEDGASSAGIFNAFKNRGGIEYVRVVKNQQYDVDTSNAVYKLVSRSVHAPAYGHMGRGL